MRYIKSFNESQNHIQLNLESYYDTVELIPISELIKFREFDRADMKAKNGHEGGMAHSRDTIEYLKSKILREGFTTPLIIAYSQNDKRVLITEGNHRLQAGIELGMKYLPGRVYRTMKFDRIQKSKSMKVSGVEPNQHHYVPGDLRPSQVGIPGCKPLKNKQGNLYESTNEAATYQQYVMMAYDNTESIPKREEKTFRGPDALAKVVKYSKNLILTNSDITTINIYKTKRHIGDANNLVRWYGDGDTSRSAENWPVYYGKYLYGLLGAYDNYISKSKNYFKIISNVYNNEGGLRKGLFGTTEKDKSMWGILLRNYTKDIYDRFILKSDNAFQILNNIKEKDPESFEKLLEIDPKIETGAEMGGLGFQ